MRKLLIILGVPIDDLTMDQALDRIDEFVAAGRASGRAHQIATVNADFVVNSLHDPELRRILQESDMATADGMPLVWGARLLGVPLQDRVTGADMVPALAARAAEKGHSLFLLGAKPGVAARAAEILVARHPGLRIAGVLSPAVAPIEEMDPSVLEAIREARPDIVLVAFGNPKQEKWINMYARQLGVPVAVGVGGTLDMIAGVSRRAPRWMQRTGLEWAYRLAQEPRRLLKRYLQDLVYFGSFFVRQWWMMRRATPSPVLPDDEAVAIEQTVVLNLRGRLDVGNRAAFMARAEQALAEHPFLVVNLAGADFLDSSALGALVALSNKARAAGGKLVLAAVPAHLMGLLRITRLDSFFEILPDVESGLHLGAAPPPPEPAQELNGWQLLRAPRTLDNDAVPALLAHCRQLLEYNPHLVIDLSETVFLSSAGLSALVTLHSQAKAAQGGLRLAGCSYDVHRTIKLAKLDTVIPLYETVRLALCLSSLERRTPLPALAAQER